MLIRFEVANYRSIFEPIELSMVAVDRDRPAARAVANLGESLLTVAAIYGPNASGKSNVIAALTWLRNAVYESLRYWDDAIPVEPFAFAEADGRPSGFTLESVIDDVRFEYVVELDRNAVRYEALFHYPERKRRRIFEREADDLRLQRGLGNLSGTRELLTSRTLALSIMRRFDEPLVSDFARDLIGGQTLGLKLAIGRRQRTPRLTSTMHWFDMSREDSQQTLPGLEDWTGQGSNRDQALALLQLADLGIDDVVIDEEVITYGSADNSPLSVTGRRIRMVHRAAEQRVLFDIALESEGTRTWFRLIGPVLAALRSGTQLLFDELDSSLHPTLSRELIRLFHDPATNPKGAQLIFTSHDTSLLNHLNRDEVWLTEKTQAASTRLGALAEFAGERVRKAQNIERAYLNGRFGALPDTDRTEVLRALGLIG